MILSIDTTAAFGSIALCDGVALVEEVPLYSEAGYGQILFPRIEELLRRHGVHVREIECFAAASGPGSFTGVRVGLTAAKGLAEAAGKQVVAISNLRVLASFGNLPLRAPVLDARRGQVFGAVYDALLELRSPEVVMAFQDWLTTLPDKDVEIIAQDAFAEHATLAPRALAGAIGRIAAREFAAGRARDPVEIDANYVRRSDAELLWKDAP